MTVVPDANAPTTDLPAGRIARGIATLDPGYFASVMASGIVSIGTDLLGFSVLSQIMLAVTVLAFALMSAAYLWRMAAYWNRFRRSLQEPTSAMAFFTVVAGADVLAVRLSMAGHPNLTLALGAFAALVWLLLTYGLPFSIVATARRPVLGELNGTWLIWVVATQSLAIVATTVAPAAPGSWLRAELPVIGVCLWGLGVMLYLVLIVLIFQRLLLVEVTPAEMGPSYWIAMGATAISVRGAAGILALGGPNRAISLGELRPFLIGLSVVLWSFGTWWIPLLVLFGIWRYVISGYSRAYEPRLWSVVFPLGMYTVASDTLGRAAHLDFMVTIARGWLWVGVASFVGVAAAMTTALVRVIARGNGDRDRSL